MSGDGGAPLILVVEDNPITRKLFRLTLETAGYGVVEAGDGQEALELAQRRPPALIMQDLRLPDMTGFELAERLRGLAQSAAVPIVAVSGLLTGTEESRIAGAGFQDLLTKPVEPSRLVAVVAAYLPRASPGGEPPRGRRRVLLVDDEPVQRKLEALRLEDAGYAVETASDGFDALNRARHNPPDAIVSDVLMPALDGFGLCRAVRQDPRLATIPVVLVSSSYVEEADRTLARRVGADASVLRTPELSEVLAALTETESPDRVPPTLVLTEFLMSDHLQRVVTQMDRQVALAGTLARRNATLTAELAAVDGIARVLARTVDPNVAARQVLATCLEAGGVSEGAMYVDRNGAPLVLRTAIGFGGAGGGPVEDFFGHRDVLARLVAGPAPVSIPSAAVPEGTAREILRRAGVEALVVAAIPIPGGPTGALVMGSHGRGGEPEEWRTFARAVGTQLGQAIALARTARTNELLLTSTGDGILAADTGGRLTFVNPAAAAMLGRTADALNGAALHDVVHARPGDAHCATEGCGFEALLTGDGGVAEGTFLRADGGEIPVEYDCRPIREGPERAGFVVAFRDMSERLRARRLATLEATRRQQLQIKDEFLAQVSHELRTPLTAIREFTTILLERLAGPLAAEQEEFLGIVLRNADELRMMIDDLLESGRSEEARLSVHPVPMALPAVVDEVVALSAGAARLKGVQVTRELAPDLPAVYGDPVRVRQILGNLVGNAIKFTPAGGRVTVRAQRAAGEEALTIAVTDTGPGVPASEVERIFEYLYQGANIADVTRKGFGIGLHLCKDLVTRLGGRIWVESAPGRGSTFTFTLPVHVAARAASA